jgi:hypothetical protein
MTVNLSALAGAGQQFFDNNGNPLSGGKLYSYAAGTTTPQATYTTAAGNIAHTNPIILNSAGRVVTGEIWLTAGQNYKFVLTTSTDVTIATWDNITGINGTGIASNAVNVQYDPAGTGAVATTVQAKLRQTVSIKDFGAVGDGVTDDTLAFVGMAAYVNTVGSNVTIYFPLGNYVFSPQNHFSSLNAWRFAVEIVNVDNVTISGYGATLTQVIPNSWVVNDPANYYNDEGAIQFRSSGDGTCKNIVIQGLNIVMKKLTYSAGFGDGASFGIGMRGINTYRISDCTISNASTDGIYCGPTYSNAYAGSYGQILNCNVTNSNRNGLSVVNNSNVQIIGGNYNDSNGGSFQAGIDLEPDSPSIQSNIIVQGVSFANNALRGLAAIRTTDLVINGNTFNSNAKDITFEGSVSRVEIVNNNITCNSTAGLGIDISGANNLDIDILNNKIYMPGTPNYFIRLGLTGATGYSNYTVKNNSLLGESGIYLGAIGGICDVSGNTHYAKVINGNTSDTNVFTWVSIASNLKFTNNTIVIDSSITWSGTVDKFIFANGYAEGNKFISHSGAVTFTRARTASQPIEFGGNEWNQYFYYDEGINSANFRIFGKGCGVAYQGDGGPSQGGTYGARIVIGGFARTTNAGAADNRVSDVTYAWANTSGNPIAYRCTVAGVLGVSAGTWVGLWNKS